LLARVREAALGAYAHQDLPFEKLVEELQPERDLSRAPLFQTMFTVQSAPPPPFRLSGLTLEPVEIDRGVAKFDLVLEIVDQGQDLSGTLEYNTDLFEEETAARLIGHYQALLEGIAADPGQRLSRLPLLTAGERRRLLVEWNETAADYPRDQCAHQLFEAQVE